MSSSTISLQAPAKLNTFLHVVGRRADGFHELQTAFVRIDWSDQLELEVRSDGCISRDVVSNATDVEFGADDLCTRAARVMQDFAFAKGLTSLGVHIRLSKNIPAQAGLGGGSSDAAAVLLGLNRLWQLDIPQSELARMAVQLGADVPFFLLGDHAWAEGIGEELTPLPKSCFAEHSSVLVVKPRAGVSTPDIFRSPQLHRSTPRHSLEDYVVNATCFGHNDLQAVAVAICPDVGEALRWVNQRLGRAETSPMAARMSGSGSAVFAFLQEPPPPLTDLPTGWQARICRLV